jgi:pimeloyl-ACP methyl ester carboxylesterase
MMMKALLLFLWSLLMRPSETNGFDFGFSKPHVRREESRRRLPWGPEECDKILDEITADDIREALARAITTFFDSASVAGIFLLSNIQLLSVNGIQVRKICASCQDFDVNHAEYQRYCGPDAYGYNETFSGLAILPLDQNGSTAFQTGTLPGILYTHGSTADIVPSVSYPGGIFDASVDVLGMGIFPASLGFPVVMPDFLGYGVALGKVYKGYLIKQSYETSIIPLWYKAAQILREESDCRTALANELVVIGYSEGGYASTVVSRALYTLGWSIIKLFAGAVPAKVAGPELIPRLVENVDKGNISLPFFSLTLASSYSSTYKDVANYNKGQDMLRASTRDAVVDMVSSANTTLDYENLIAAEGNLNIFSNDLVAFMREIIQTGDPDPCGHPSQGLNDYLCAALKENDLTDMLETIPFPTVICHSVDDELVSFGNVVNITKNANLTLIKQAGLHGENAVPCFAHDLSDLVSNDIRNYPVQPKHSIEGCSSSATDPAIAESPTLTPTFSGDRSDAVPCHSSIISLLGWLFVIALLFNLD